MAMENATGEEEAVEAQVDVVRLAGKFLREKWEKAKRIFDLKAGKLATVANLQPHEVADSAERISAFLGKGNWSRRKASDLIRLGEKHLLFAQAMPAQSHGLC